MKYRFFAGHSDRFPVRTMCRLLGASRSGYYDWRFRPLSDRALEDRRLLPLIRASYAASGGVYGYRRVHLDLRETGETYGKHRIARIMKANDIKAIYGYKIPRVTYGRPLIVTPNKLQRAFTVARPDMAWVTDITYIRTWQGWLYLAVVLDLFSRKVVSWSMKPTLAREIVLDALLMAIWRRKPDDRVLVHSDQRSQYGSDDWQRFCRHHNLEPSMSRKDNCWDNAVAESFFSSLKRKNGSRNAYTKRGIWPASMSLITSKCSTIESGDIAISAMSARRPSRQLHCEARQCPENEVTPDFEPELSHVVNGNNIWRQSCPEDPARKDSLLMKIPPLMSSLASLKIGIGNSAVARAVSVT